MKYILTLITSILLLISCLNGNDKNKQNRELEKELNPVKLIHDDVVEESNSSANTFSPDTNIGPISLLNSKMIDIYLGENVMDRIIDDEKTSVVSSDLQQRLTVYFHPGSSKNEFSEFQIEYIESKRKNERIIDSKEFKTESGIKLGMTIDDLHSIKGDPEKITIKNTVVLHYRIDDLKNSEFLKIYNMPIYYADYEINNGYLNKFRFGFYYP